MALKHLSCSEWTYLVLTLLLLTTSTIGFAMFAAFFPPAMVGLGLHQTYIAPIFSSFTVGNVLCSIASAPLATRFGRRPILFCGVVCVSAGSLVFGLVPDIISGELPMVLFFSAARCVQGGGGGIVNAVALSMLSDQFPKNKGKVLGVASTAGSMAFFVGPPVGGILYELGGFRLPFILSAVLPPVCYFAGSFFAPAIIRTPRRSSSGAYTDESPTLMDHLVRLREISSAELFMPAVCGFIISCKWTTFDIGVTMWMQEEFGYTIGQASLAFSCASFAYACGSPLAGSVSDCVPKPKRKYMINGALYFCGCSSMSIGEYQLRWDVSVRKVVAYMFCSQEGLCSTFLQAPILPTMQDAAHAADRAHKLQRFGYSSKGSGEAEEEEEEQDEMTTNITTSVFTTIRMGGAILGPAVGAEMIATQGFRKAIPFWGMVMLCAAVVYSAQLLLWAWLFPDKATGAKAAAVADEEVEGERERLVG